MIRPGTPEDAEDVARVHVRTWQAAYAGLLPGDRLSEMTIGPRAEMWRRRPPIVAERDGEVVGFVAVGASRDDDADGELYAIYVDPDHWGTGVGRKLIDAGETQLRTLEHHHVVLWVFEDNARARRFYEAAGWQLNGARRPIEMLGVSVPEVRYRKEL